MAPLPSYEEQLAALERAVGAAIFAKFLAALARLQLGLTRLLARLSALPAGPDFGRRVTEYLENEVPRVIATLPADYQTRAWGAVERAYVIGGGERGGYIPSIDLVSIVAEQVDRAERMTHPS